MYRMGHVGAALIVYAPVAFFLMSTGNVALAAVGLFGMLLIEPLPDRDLELPWLTHRGGSHTLLCAALVGVFVGSVVFTIGRWLRAVLVAQLTETGQMIGTVDLAATAPLSFVFDRLAVPAGPVLTRAATSLAGVDVWALAAFAFVIAVLAVVSHLLGDVLTPRGIRPFWPVSSRTISMNLTTADSSTANTVLFVGGWVVLAGAARVGIGPSETNGTLGQIVTGITGWV